MLTNFLYGRKAHQEKSRAIGVVANELFIENYLRRSFAWYNSELWLEDIPPHCKVVVCLAAKDDVLNAKKIKREIDIHMSEKGVEMDLDTLGEWKSCVLCDSTGCLESSFRENEATGALDCQRGKARVSMMDTLWL